MVSAKDIIVKPITAQAANALAASALRHPKPRSGVDAARTSTHSGTGAHIPAGALAPGR